MDDLTEEEREAVIAALKEKLDREMQYRFAPRLTPFRSALAKLDPTAPQSQLIPIIERPPLPKAPMRSRGGKRVR